MATYPYQAEQSRDFVGVTSQGQVLVVERPVAYKNSGETPAATVAVLREEGSEVLASTSGSWAAWSKGHLLVLHKGHFLFYDQHILD